MRRVAPFLSCTLFFVAAASGAAESPKVALTFDDLPVHSALPPGMSRSDVARSILAALRKAKAPATYGFVNAKSIDGQADNLEVLKLWRAAGHPLGNHSFSHMDLHANTAEAFEQDVAANEAALREEMGERGDWRLFRYPYLREGDTLEKHRHVREYLRQNGYQVAEVTLSFDDYAYNEPYARCVAKKDAAGIGWLKESYMTRAGNALANGQADARLVFGRDIPHVMLLHIGGFETVMLPKLLGLLRQRGFALVTLQEAQRDPAYADPDVAWLSGASLLRLAAAAKHVELPARSDDVFAKLTALCR